MRKKLLIINGAGASLDFGMLGVAQIDSRFETWAQELVPLSDDSDKSLYSWVKEQLESYCSRNTNNWKDRIINFENILYTLQFLSELGNDRQRQHFNQRLNPFIDLRPFPTVVRYGGTKAADGDDFRLLHTQLVDRLLIEMRKQCSTLASDKPAELEQLGSFLGSLRQQFELGIINLNYDNVLTTAMPDLRTGFDPSTGLFDRAQLYRSDWHFCYHPHGSVHFDMHGGKDTEMHKIVWNSDLTTTFKGNASGRSGNFTGEGMMHLTSSIIAGLDKANQVLREPFAQYYMLLDRLLYESDAILFIGYGFGDWHLNKLFPFIRYDPTKTRKVVILDWANKDTGGLYYRHDAWSSALFQTIPFNGRKMGIGKQQFTEPKPAVYFKNRKLLEKSADPDHPLAVWYNGLLAACAHADLIQKELH
jgi:hypothetical protein